MDSRGLVLTPLLSAILAELHFVRSFNPPSIQQQSWHLPHQLVQFQVLRQVASGGYEATAMNALGRGLRRAALQFPLMASSSPTYPVGAEYEMCSKIIVIAPPPALHGFARVRPCMDVHDP